METRIKGRELVFISKIKRDGSGVEPVDKEYIEMMADDSFAITTLSISMKTYIASHMNSFVVKLKNEPEL